MNIIIIGATSGIGYGLLKKICRTGEYDWNTWA